MRQLRDLSSRDKSFQLDEHGFLADPETWSRSFAKGMAHRLGIAGDLSLDHWRVIFFVRRYFEHHRDVPRIHETCRGCRASRQRLTELFPQGYQRGVCRIAGLPYAFIERAHYALTYETVASTPPGYEVCDAGHLVDFWAWDDGFAIHTAREGGGLELGADHWRVIDFIRAAYIEKGRAPTLQQTCAGLGLTRGRLSELFPEGYRGGAFRLAGLPALAR
jgi:tRNA 2-thiouridine synthesizing protein E